MLRRAVCLLPRKIVPPDSLSQPGRRPVRDIMLQVAIGHVLEPQQRACIEARVSRVVCDHPLIAVIQRVRTTGRLVQHPGCDAQQKARQEHGGRGDTEHYLPEHRCSIAGDIARAPAGRTVRAFYAAEREHLSCDRFPACGTITDTLPGSDVRGQHTG